jgi:transposase
VAALEAKLAAPAKHSGNSSLPPTKSYKPNRPPRGEGSAKRGPKAGHAGVTRLQIKDPDYQDEAAPAVCGDCGHSLDGVKAERVERRQVIDLPPVQPVVFEAARPVVVCPGCRSRQQAAFPPAFRGPTTFGSRLQAFATYLHEVESVPYARLQRALRSLFGLQISLGSLVALVQRAGVPARAAAEEIRQAVVGEAVVASDETPLRVHGVSEWLWVLRTLTASYFTARPSRGADVVRRVLGDAQPEVWLSDLLTSQQAAPAKRFQICLAHQLRDLAYAEDYGDRVFAPAMAQVFRQGYALAQSRPDLAAEVFAQRWRWLEAQTDRLLALDGIKPAGAKLQARYLRHRDKLFVFLDRPDVAPDNNGCERDLRNAAVHRKVCGSFRSDWAPDTYAAVLSIIETAKKRARDPFEALADLLPAPLSAPT